MSLGRCAFGAICCLLVFAMPGYPALETARVNYDAEPGQQVLNMTTNRIVELELELLKMNTNYRLQSTKQSKLKPWRVALFNLATYGVSNAGIDSIAYSRWKYWRNPAANPRKLQQTGPILLLTAHSIGLAGVLLETTLDAINDYKTQHKGFDRKTFLKRVSELVSEIDGLILKREALIAACELSQQDGQLIAAETAVIKDLREAAILEQERLNVRACKWRVARNTGNLVSALSLASGGYLGSLMGLRAVNERKPRFAGPAGIGFVVSGALIVVNPIVTRLSANFASKLAMAQTRRKLGNISPAVLESLNSDNSKLSGLLSDNSGQDSSILALAVRNRQNACESASIALNRMVVMGKAEQRQANKDLVERLVSNTIIGGTKIGWGAQLANAGFGFHKVAPTPTVKFTVPFGGTKLTLTKPKPRTPASLFNHRVAQGATTFIPGTAWGILDTLQNRIRGEVKTQKQLHAGTAPAQLLKDRLKSLEQAQDLVKASGKSSD